MRYQDKEKIVAIIAMVVLVLLVVGSEISASVNEKEYVVTVTDKERIYMGSKGSKYVVFCDDEDGNALVFQNTDSLFRWKWNSSNMQSELKYGKKYKIRVVGHRVPVLSMYQNIIEADEVK